MRTVTISLSVPSANGRSTETVTALNSSQKNRAEPPRDYRRVTRWEHQAVIEALEARLDREPGRMRVRRQTAEHPFGTFKAWMGHTHFQMRALKRVSTETSLHVLVYNLKRVMNVRGTRPLIRAIRYRDCIFRFAPSCLAAHGHPFGDICAAQNEWLVRQILKYRGQTALRMAGKALWGEAVRNFRCHRSGPNPDLCRFLLLAGRRLIAPARQSGQEDSGHRLPLIAHAPEEYINKYK
jgi:hypothetical protein